VKTAAIQRLPAPSVEGAAFVVVVNGKRVYVGAFKSSLSSISSAVSSVVVDRVKLGVNPAQSVFTIERAYPAASFGAADDPRGDVRIKQVLENLKLVE
jgi:hypothetical protein